MNSGWIKLHRQFLDWEWYSDHNVCRLFLHCLIKANHKEKKWQGKTINEGSFISSRDHLSAETGLSIQQIRTSINKLISTSELTIKTSNRFTLFSITYWEKYQDTNQQVNDEITNKQQTDNKRITTNKNVKNVKNVKEEKNTPSPKVSDPVPFSKIVDLYHEKLPELPNVEKLTTTRKGYIRQRWIEDLTDIKHWENYFDYVKQSDFLMGKTQPVGDRRPFRCTLEWLTKPANFAKVSEEQYHG